jgi:hypothetical protein
MATVTLAATGAWSGRSRRPADTFAITPQQFWDVPFERTPNIPLAGDADGDGHADLLSVATTAPGVIEMMRTSPLGKPIERRVVLDGFGSNAIGAACGPFAGKAAAVLGIFADGSVRLAWGITPGAAQLQHNSVVAQIPQALIPKAPVRVATGDFEGNGRSDALALSGDGGLLLLRNKTQADSEPSFEAIPLTTRLLGSRQFAAGVFAGNDEAQCVYLLDSGTLKRAFVSVGSGLARLERETAIGDFSPDEHLAVGRFRGKKVADILIGRHLLSGGNPGSETTLGGVPDDDTAKKDGTWLAADIDGNGKDDLIRFRNEPGAFGGLDTYVHFSYDASDAAPGYFCSSNDGLPDIWKTGKIKPAGLDLGAMGCRVGHRDLIVQLDRFDNIDEGALRGNMDRAAKYYASLPIQTPDGTHGISVHFIYGKPIPVSDHDKIDGNLSLLYRNRGYVGVMHACIAARDGGGATANGCRGPSWFDGGWPTFIHEMGHQLDLRHDGYYVPTTPGFPSLTGCALYPSLMSYTYSYSLNDNPDDIGYSDGARASFHVNELHLSEHLPFPIDTVKFLAGGPYHFKIKPDASGKGTLVDWNWNGIFGEEDVCADINYSHGADFGPRYDIAKCQTAPALVAQVVQGNGKNPRILIFYGRDSHLFMRVWLGADRDADGAKWSDEYLAGEGVSGDPTGVTMGSGITWACFSTPHGIVLRSVSLDADDKPSFGDPVLIPHTELAEATVAAFGDRLAILVWRGPRQHVGLFLGSVFGQKVHLTPREMSLDMFSEVPVGAAAGASTRSGPTLWVARIDGSLNKGHTEAVQFALGADNELAVQQRRLLDGTYAPHRMTLLWQMEAGMQPDGRLYQFTGGQVQQGRLWSEQYMTMNVPYPDIGGGWLVRRYDQPDFTSLSAPGACFYDNNIIYAVRVHSDDPNANDVLGVGFYGNGATAMPMGDFDDYGHIRDIGLSHSIAELSL